MGHVILFVGILGSSIAFAGEAAMEAPWFLGILRNILNQFPELNMWFATIMVFVMSALRALSELLFFISRKTESTADDDLAMLVGRALDWIATVVGWFGIGAPRK